ncbi:MAG: hypothetical protein AB1816_10095 [Bacillota bacterium]
MRGDYELEGREQTAIEDDHLNYRPGIQSFPGEAHLLLVEPSPKKDQPPRELA